MLGVYLSIGCVVVCVSAQAIGKEIYPTKSGYLNFGEKTALQCKTRGR